MIQKGFLKTQRKTDLNNNRFFSIVSKLMLYLGIFIMISALIYMIVNMTKADSIISVWLPFMIAGVFLVFMSQLIKWQYLGARK